MKLNKNKWITEPFTFIEIDGDLWVKLDANHLERLPNGSFTKWIRAKIKSKSKLEVKKW